MTDAAIPAEVEAACRGLIMSFAHHLDHRRFPEVAALFTDDGAWHRRGKTMHGPAQILAFLQQRPATVVELHVMTTTHVQQLTDTTCSATSYATIYRSHRSGDDIPGIKGPNAIGEFSDRFELTPHGWRFTHRTSRPVFTIENTP